VTAISLVVPASLDGVRVDKAVALLAELSRSSVDRLVDEGRVEVDGIVVTSRRTVLRVGQRLQVERTPATGPGPLEADPSVCFAVVHEDAEVIVVDKPAGLVVHPGAGHREGTLVHGLLARFPDLGGLSAVGEASRPGIVHRLDRGTSGLLVVARTADSYHSLVSQLRERRVSRRYQALAFGTVEGEAGVIEAPIGRSRTSPTRMAVSGRGKEARTRYQVVRRFDRPAETTLLEVTLDTGRTHQIRVHLSSIGHPVVGDPVYGRGRRLEGSSLTRPFLHAAQLSFDHPSTGQRLSFESPLPEDLSAQLAVLDG
jgi:23S rRNA pseudouridine1911/1915/1917 synthase